MNPSKTPSEAKIAELSYHVPSLSEGKHSVFLYLPPPYHAHIGLIVAHWGNFETAFDICLGALIEAESADGQVRNTLNWRLKNYKTRRKLFKEICNDWLALKKADVASRLVEILDESANLHHKRNLIVHGNYSYVIPANSSAATNCYVFNAEKNEKMHFDEGTLRTIHHDISHLTGDLFTTFGIIARIEGAPFMVFPDKDLISIYHDTVHPWNPDPSKR